MKQRSCGFARGAVLGFVSYCGLNLSCSNDVLWHPPVGRARINDAGNACVLLPSDHVSYCSTVGGGFSMERVCIGKALERIVEYEVGRAFAHATVVLVPSGAGSVDGGPCPQGATRIFVRQFSTTAEANGIRPFGIWSVWAISYFELQLRRPDGVTATSYVASPLVRTVRPFFWPVGASLSRVIPGAVQLGFRRSLERLDECSRGPCRSETEMGMPSSVSPSEIGP